MDSDAGQPDPGLLDALYRGVTDPASFERALVMIGSAFRCKSTALVAFDSRLPGADIVLTTGVFDQVARDSYRSEFAALDPAPAAFSRIRVGTATTTERLFSENTARHGTFVHEFFRPLGLVETLGGHLRGGKGRFELVGLHRGSDREAFTSAEVADVERICAHLARALQLRRVFVGQQTRLAALEAGLDRMSTGIILLDALSTPLFANAAIRSIARRGDGIGLDRTGRLLISDLSARKRIDGLLFGIVHGASGGVVAIPNQNGPRPYSLLVAPAPPTVLDALSEGGRGGSILIINDPVARSPIGPRVLQEALNLPLGAAQLVLALTTDSSLKDFADERGITIHTARFHLRTAMARTGARTQAQLVRLAVEILRDLDIQPPQSPL